MGKLWGVVLAVLGFIVGMVPIASAQDSTNFVDAVKDQIEGAVSTGWTAAKYAVIGLGLLIILGLCMKAIRRVIGR